MSSVKLPAFLVEVPVSATSRGGGDVRLSFLEKGLAGVAGIIRTAYAQWEKANGDSWYHRLDARVKLLFLLSAVIVASSRHTIAAQATMLVSTMLIAWSSGIGIAAFVKRTAALAAFFGFFVSAPAMLNVIVPGDVVVPFKTFEKAYDIWIYHVPRTVGLTAQGIRSCIVITLRVANSVSLSLLLLSTTPFACIARSLRVLRVPDVVVLLLTLTYKYIFLFARTVEDLHLAKKSRLAAPVSDADARSWAAGSIAMLFRRTQRRCDDVYKAMLARGFSDATTLSAERRLEPSEIGIAAAFICLLSVIVWMPS